MRRLRRGKAKRQKELLILVTLALFSVLTVGYAAFQTNITLTSKGNVKKYKVTFDPNGGVLDKDSKYVGKVYGDLPTPTREGYNFLGWNGKNVFPDSDLVTSTKWTPNQNVEVTKTSDYTQVIYKQTNSTPGYIYRYDNTVFEAGKTYTVSVLAKGINTNKLQLGIYGKILNAWENLSTSDFTILTRTFTYESQVQNFILFYQLGPNLNSGFQIKWIYIEEGSEATPYEPYYITSETEVVQKQDHTLTAIWEKIPEEQIQ